MVFSLSVIIIHYNKKNIFRLIDIFDKLSSEDKYPLKFFGYYALNISTLLRKNKIYNFIANLLLHIIILVLVFYNTVNFTEKTILNVKLNSFFQLKAVLRTLKEFLSLDSEQKLDEIFKSLMELIPKDLQELMSLLQFLTELITKFM